MLNEIATNTKIKKLFAYHAKEMIATLKNEGLHFSIACDTKLITFTPHLSAQMRERIGKISVFVLSGYSFESIEMFDGFFSFEAGLVSLEGEDIATLLRVPYVSVVQILAQDGQTLQSVPLFINPIEQSQDLEDSMIALLSKNTDLVK